jgi:hypothetical protein
VIEIGLVHVVARTGAFAVARNGRRMDSVQFGWRDDPLPMLAADGGNLPRLDGVQDSALVYASRVGGLLQTI